MMKNNLALATQLQKLWADNFLVYFKSHVFHFNIQGSTFESDHKFFRKLYEFLFAMHDTIGEQIRQLDKPVLVSLSQLIEASSMDEAEPSMKEAKVMYAEIIGDLEDIIITAQHVYDTAEENGCAGCSTMLGDYLSELGKFSWMAKATIGRSIR